MRLWDAIRNWMDCHFRPVRLSLGARGELAAAKFLRRKGLRILGHSVSDRLGEIDLIAVEKRGARRLVFVEVKTRTASTDDHPTERVDLEKQRRLTRAALAYLKRHKLLEHPTRFDVVAVWWPEGGRSPSRIEHYENAFEPVGVRSLFT
jgi:putative endonuclease